MPADFRTIATIGRDMQAVQGIPLGRLSALEARIALIEQGGQLPQTATGTVNGVNQVFTFATAPAIIIVDQVKTLQKTSSDGTVNWTGTTTVTLSVAPTFDIFGI